MTELPYSPVEKVEPVKVVVFSAGYPPAKLGGGPIRTLAALIEQQPDGFRSVVVSSDRDLGGSQRLPVQSNRLIDGAGRDNYYVSTGSIRSLARCYLFVRSTRPDVLYLNSFFDPVFSLLPQLAKALRFLGPADVVLASRGEFSLGALAIKTRKKRAFLLLYRALGFHRHLVWHASSEREMQDIRREFGQSATVLMREDETHLPEFARLPIADRSDETLRIVFLSRISEKKGLHRLLESLMGTKKDIDLSVYGSIEDRNYFDECDELSSRLPANVSYDFRGAIDPELARDTFADFDLFAFPSAGENFGHVIAESLSVSCPVMCSDNTPWTPFIEVHDGGVLVDSLDPAVWGRAIDSYASLTVEERMLKRINAGASYEVWQRADKGEHIFELAQREFSRSDGSPA